jgi:lysozyme family protein
MEPEMTTIQEIKDLVDQLPEKMMAAAASGETEEFNALQVMLDALQPIALGAAIGDFRAATAKFANISAALAHAMDKLETASSRQRLQAVFDRFGAIHGEVSGAETEVKTWENGGGAGDAPADEKEDPPAGGKIEIEDKDVKEPPLVDPKPKVSTEFAALSDEYVTFFKRAGFRSAAARDDAVRFAKIAAANKAVYKEAGDPLGIPWWFVATLHMLEASFNFNTHLHNGDPLNKRTVQVPKGRPVDGGPPFTWSQSARDALTFENLAGLKDWSLARALHRFEAFNGFGYRQKQIPSPYLWSMTKIYSKGKFVKDGMFSKTAVSKQCGAAALLMALADIGAVAPLEIAGLPEGEADAQLSDGIDAGPAAAGAVPNIDGAFPAGHGFEQFFNDAFGGGVTHFAWHEFLVKGSQNATSHLNSDPPKALWNNVIPLVRVLERFRQEIGHTVVLTSVYRSPAYNASVPGSAKSSQHMNFQAADFKVPEFGDPAVWAEKMRGLRKAGVFSGGIGRYKTFVHVDVRGYDANWLGAGVA